jgi:hypothetical protein
VTTKKPGVKWSKITSASWLTNGDWWKFSPTGDPSACVSWRSGSSATRMSTMFASTTTEKASVLAIAPRTSSVVAAFRPFGLRNAGTPFAIDSTPVRAALPDANARRRRNASASPPSPDVYGSSATSRSSAVSASGRPPPRSSRPKPHPTIRSMETMKM